MIAVLRRLLLRIALGDRCYQYMVRTLCADPRLVSAREADVVVRKDGVERRIEADWLKPLARLVKGRSLPIESRTWLSWLDWERFARRRFLRVQRGSGLAKRNDVRGP